MKTYDEIKTDMQEVYNEIRKLEEEKKSLIWNKKDITAYKTYTENLHNINFQILILNLKYEILQNNRNCAMYNQVMPMAFEVLKKYFGKRYGEKTRKKICDEIKDKTGFYFRIYSYHYTISERYAVTIVGSIECGRKNCGILLDDNVIQPITLEEMTSYDAKEYVEDIGKRVTDLYVLHLEAENKRKELEEICKRFNDRAVGDINRIYADEKFDTWNF